MIKYPIFKTIACIFFITIIVQACDYKREPLPSKLVSDYELAIPIADTTFNFADAFLFDDILSIPEVNFEISPGTIGPRSFTYPFYLANFLKKGQILGWIEPKAIFKSTFLDKVDVIVNVYIRDSYNENIHTLAKNIQLKNGENVLFGDVNSRISVETFEELKRASNILLEMKLIIKENISLKDLQNCVSNLKIGLKLGIRLGFSI